MLPGYDAVRIEEMQWALSTKKQSDYDTPVADADLNKAHTVREANVAEVTKELRSDRETYGKGHEFTEQVWEVARDIRMSRSMDGSSFILGWALAFAMGKVVTTQPDAAGHPNTKLHTITFFDPDVEGSINMPVTSIVESISPGIKRLLYSMAVPSVTITAEGFEHLNTAVDLIGSGKSVASSLDMPDLTTVSYLASNYATIKLGDSGEDISTRVRSWSVVINNNPREGRGYFPSSGLYRGRLEIGSRSIVPALVVDINDTDADLLDDFLNQTELALEIYAEGDYTSGDTYKHYLRLRFPRLLYRAVPLSEADGIWSYAVSFDEETVIYKSGDSPNPLITVEVQNETESYLT